MKNAEVFNHIPNQKSLVGEPVVSLITQAYSTIVDYMVPVAHIVTWHNYQGYCVLSFKFVKCELGYKWCIWFLDKIFIIIVFHFGKGIDLQGNERNKFVFCI